MRKTLVVSLIVCGFLQQSLHGQEPPVTTSPDCGPNCLYISLRSLDIAVEIDDLKQRLGTSGPTGYSLGELDAAAKGFGARTLAVRTSLDNLQRRNGRFSCLAWVDGNHFVLVHDVRNGEVDIVDPPHRVTQPATTFNTRWDGTALLVSNDTLVPEDSLGRRTWGWWLAVIPCVIILALGITRYRGS